MKGRLAALAAALLLLWGCSAEAVREMDHPGGPFANDLDSARGYLLGQLRDKYGVEFAVVGEESLENYGPLAGATYTCDAAPVDQPDRVTTALVSQTKYRKVRDDYARYFFREEAEAPARVFLEGTGFVREWEVELRLPQTERVWGPEDDPGDFLADSGAYLDLKIWLGEGRTDEEYAGLILELLEGVRGLNANSKVSVLESEKTYLYWGIITALGEELPPLPTKEEILEQMEISRMM